MKDDCFIKSNCLQDCKGYSNQDLFFFSVVFCARMWHDCQPNQYFQVVFKIWVLKWLQKIRILFVFKEINYHVLK